jgi:hypothetical protein
LRVVRLPEAEGGGAVYDAIGKRSGRGAYVCATEACLGQAIKQKKLERSLRTPLSEETIAALQQAITKEDASK